MYFFGHIFYVDTHFSFGYALCMAFGDSFFNCACIFTCHIFHMVILRVYCLLLGGCYVYNSTINLLQPAQGDKVTISPVARVCI